MKALSFALILSAFLTSISVFADCWEMRDAAGQSFDETVPRLVRFTPKPVLSADDEKQIVARGGAGNGSCEFDSAWDITWYRGSPNLFLSYESSSDSCHSTYESKRATYEPVECPRE
jgi:hypothetical protein